ncbi:MAG: NAD(P)(+) transhydrogenase (Re/Si-specific) subunit beta [Planctomycetes bacterium]|nr:NAD(P)(+) transhydrogenase (Re/Si-specific) subunit beta [Planctomycetota bacterium]
MRLSKVRTARSGNVYASVGMLLAIVGVLMEAGKLNWYALVAGMMLGSAVGVFIAVRTPMTAMPEMVGALNGLGGGASTLVALGYLVEEVAKLQSGQVLFDLHDMTVAQAITVPVTLLVGGITFSGSFMAFFKLRGKNWSHPLQGAARHGLHAVLGILVVLISVWMINGASGGFGITLAAGFVVLVALALGVFLVMPIGGADMPVVISLLNSYSGIAGAASGFVVGNELLVVSGALVGASGIILTQIMCKAMNRSLGNVLLGGLGETATGGAKDSEYKGVKSATPEELALLFDGATSCIVVPGYGLAVAQAQHTVRELDELLEKRGCKVRYAIHPVAGRMPGHMNVLLAEADVPYEKLLEMDAINPDFKQTDIVIVVGANDVVNPAARTEKTSPIYGMPILDVDQARTVIVLKRSLSPGYAGIKNPLFELPNCLMLFQDAKQGLQALLSELKAA